MKIYIRALQQGSDLSDVVEEKLLIGDRPKLSSDPENKKPLGERLLERTAEEKADVRWRLSSVADLLPDICPHSSPRSRLGFTITPRLSRTGLDLTMTSAVLRPLRCWQKRTRSLSRRQVTR
jgi:hypothetical protein